MKTGSSILAVALTAALLAGCGGGGSDLKTTEPPVSSLQEIKVSLQGYGGAEDAALFMAMQRGYFRDVGLYVWGGVPATPNRTVKYVANETDDLGIAQEPQVAIGKMNGAPVVAIGSLISQPTASMVWLEKSKIRSVADLAGKTIAVPGIPYQEGLLRSVLAKAGLTPEEVSVRRVGYDLVPELLGGGADAIFGGSANREGIELEEQGAKPVVKSVQELGIPDYEELQVIAREDRVAKEPDLIRRFLSALKRGAVAAVEDPEAAVNVVANAEETDPEASRSTIEAQVKATLPLLSTSGEMDPAKADDLVDWMHAEGMLQRQLSASDLLSNAYLPEP